MKYTVDIGGGGEIVVDHLEYGVMTEGAVEGWADLYIRVQDIEEDIFDSSKNVWTDWLNANCGRKEPKERIKQVIARVYDGPQDDKVCRMIKIEHAYLSSYVEESTDGHHAVTAMIRRAPIRKGEIKVSKTNEG